MEKQIKEQLIPLTHEKLKALPDGTRVICHSLFFGEWYVGTVCKGKVCGASRAIECFEMPVVRERDFGGNKL